MQGLLNKKVLQLYLPREGGNCPPIPPLPTALQRYIPCTLERVVAVEMFEIFVTGHYSSLVGKFGDSFGGVANVSCHCMHTKNFWGHP